MTAPIVLLHGWGFTPSVWQPVIAALTALGVSPEQILAPTLPLADSDTSEALINALVSRLPDRCHLVGWSLGGELALALTTAYPERIASLTLIASTPCFMNRDDWSLGQPASLLDDFNQRLADNPTALIKRFATLIRHGDVAAARDRTLSDTLSQCADTSAARLANGLRLLRTIDLRQISIPVSVPLTMVHGTADAVVPLAAAESLQQRHDARLILIDDGSHALPCTHPAEIAAVILGVRSPA
jgi:pimeloyl-[acyl-carrier protein] methyl ester esterase